jgi:TfoX/Sxy family transcriptional regulator of competence genes
MAYDEKLAERIRQALASLDKVEEKRMIGGLTFMVNEKMCIGIIKDELMCRINPDIYESALKKDGCRPMDFTGRPMKGYVLIAEAGMKSGINQQGHSNYQHWSSKILLGCFTYCLPVTL